MIPPYPRILRQWSCLMFHRIRRNVGRCVREEFCTEQSEKYLQGLTKQGPLHTEPQASATSAANSAQFTPSQLKKRPAIKNSLLCHVPVTNCVPMQISIAVIPDAIIQQSLTCRVQTIIFCGMLKSLRFCSNEFSLMMPLTNLEPSDT